MLKRLNKLRRQFVLTNMAIVVGILAVAFLTVSGFTYRSAKRRVFSTLDKVLTSEIESETDAPPMPEEPDGNHPFFGSTVPDIYTYTVIADFEGNLISGEISSAPNPKILPDLVRAIAASETTSKYLPRYSLLYAKRPAEDGIHIAFCSSFYLEATVDASISIVGVTCLVILLILYFISRSLSAIFIKPIEEAWKSQGQFISDASHDLKTPLTVILADTELIRNSLPIDDEKCRWVDGIREEAGRMRFLVEQMLELARTEEIKGALSFEKTNLSEIAMRAALQFEPVAFEKKVNIETAIGQNIEAPTAPDHFTRMVYILVDNAIKYAKPDTSVVIRMWQKKQTVFLSVTNDGEISPSDLPHVFERFYRTDKVRAVGGYGLGLSIAKNLADAMNIDLSAASSQGKVTFRAVIHRQPLSEILWKK